MKNKFIENQIDQMIQSLEIFKSSCQLASLQDDGEVSKEEEYVLKKLDKATEYFYKELKKIKEY